MADLTIINCDAQGRIFNGASSCGNYGTGDFLGCFLSRKGTTIANNSATFLANFKTEIQKNNILPLSAYDYRNTHEDNQTTTSSIGNMQLNRLGKPAFEFDFTFSICEMKAISKINNSSQDWDLWLIYENAIVCATTSTGALTGFDLNVVHTEASKLKQGSELQIKMLKTQLHSATEYNEGMTLVPITPELVELKSLKGIVGVNVTVTPVSGTSLTVNVTDGCTGNGISGITGATNFQVLGNQTTTASVSAVVDNGGGSYTLTLTPTMVNLDTIGIQVATSTTESVLVDGVYYGGSSAVVVFNV